MVVALFALATGIAAVGIVVGIVAAVVGCAMWAWIVYLTGVEVHSGT